MTLVPCPACRRHLKADEAACPFCRQPLHRALLAGVVVAALGLTACAADPPPANVYGAPPDPVTEEKPREKPPDVPPMVPPVPR